MVETVVGAIWIVQLGGDMTMFVANSLFDFYPKMPSLTADSQT